MKSRRSALVVAVALVLVTCGGDGDSASLVGEDITVEMYDNRFQYTEIRVPVGGSITWVGAGRNPHNAVAADDSWSTERVFGSLEQYEGDEATLTYDEPGEIIFFCTFHGNAQGAGMAGTLIVGDG